MILWNYWKKDLKLAIDRCNFRLQFFVSSFLKWIRRITDPSTSSPQSYEAPAAHEDSLADHASAVVTTSDGHQISQITGPHVARTEMIQHAREDLAAIHQEIAPSLSISQEHEITEVSSSSSSVRRIPRGRLAILRGARSEERNSYQVDDEPATSSHEIQQRENEVTVAVVSSAAATSNINPINPDAVVNRARQTFNELRDIKLQARVVLGNPQINILRHAVVTSPLRAKLMKSLAEGEQLHPESVEAHEAAIHVTQSAILFTEFVLSAFPRAAERLPEVYAVETAKQRARAAVLRIGGGARARPYFPSLASVALTAARNALEQADALLNTDFDIFTSVTDIESIENLSSL